MKFRSTLPSVLIALASFATSAHAVPIQFGTSVLVDVADCVAGSTPCDRTNGAVSKTFDGMPGDSASAATISVAGYGTAAGSAALSGVIGAPVLTGSAVSNAGKWVTSNSVAIERYAYTGASDTTRTFGATLSYSQNLTGRYPPNFVGVNATIGVFTVTTPTLDIGSTPEAVFDDLLLLWLPGVSTVGFDQFSNPTTSALNALVALAVTVTLHPGDAIWIYAALQTPAPNGGSIDAAHTMVTHWDNTADLVPAFVATVPEPASWFPALWGLTFVLSRRREGVSRGTRSPRRALRLTTGGRV